MAVIFQEFYFVINFDFKSWSRMLEVRIEAKVLKYSKCEQQIVMFG